MKIQIYTDPEFKKFELREQGCDHTFATGSGADLHTVTEMQRRVNNYDDLVASLRTILHCPPNAGMIAARALILAREG